MIQQPRMVRLFPLVLLMLVLGGAGLSAQERPDTSTVRSLLEEATAALADAPRLRTDRGFITRLARLRERWGLAGDNVHSLFLEEPAHPLDSLVEAEAYDEAWEVARSGGVEARDPWTPSRLARALILAGREEEAIPLPRWLDRPVGVPYEIIRYGEGPMEARIERLRSYMRRGLVPSEQHPTYWRAIIRAWPLEELDRAVAIADSVPGLEVHFLVLDRIVVLEGGSPPRDVPMADSLLLATHRETLALEDRYDRLAHLDRLAGICEHWQGDACQILDLPAESYGNVASRLGKRVEFAVAEGRYDDADRTLDSLVTYRRPAEVALLALSALESHGAPGDEGQTWILHRIRQAEDLVPEASAPVRDDLHATLGSLLAPRDPERALEHAARIRDPDLRTRVYGTLSQTLRPLDTDAAWEAAHRGRGDPGAARTAWSLYLPFRAADDTAASREALEIMHPWQAVSAELAWADRLSEAGLWEAARRHAFRALDRWFPLDITSPLPRGLRIFVDLGVWDELVAWARARDEAGERAMALLGAASAAASPPVPVPIH